MSVADKIKSLYFSQLSPILLRCHSVQVLEVAVECAEVVVTCPVHDFIDAESCGCYEFGGISHPAFYDDAAQGLFSEFFNLSI